MAAIISVSAYSSQSLYGQTDRSWRGGGNQAFPTAIWGGPANWVNNQIADGANVNAIFAFTFNNGYACFLNTNRTLGFLTFDDPDTENDNDFILRLHSSNSALTMSAPGQPAFVVNQAPNTMIVEPRIFGTLGFAKNGPGRVVFTNPDSTYTGPIDVNEGILEFGGGIFTTSKGTDPRAASPDTVDFDTGILGRIGNGDYQDDISIALDALLFYNSDSDTILNGDISGDGALHKGRSGVLTLNGINTYAGGTSVFGGILAAGSPDSLPDYDEPGEVVFDGGTIAVRIGGDDWTEADVDTLMDNATRTEGALGIDTSNGDYVQWTAFDTTYLGPALGLTKFGDNTLTLNEVNDYAGPTLVAGGLLLLESPGSIGDGTNDLFLIGGGLDLGGQSLTVGDVLVTGAAEDGPTLSNGSITGESYTIENTTGNAILSAALLANGTIGLEKSGAGIATLAGANTYTGDTTVTSGILLGGSGGSSASSVTVETGAGFGAFVTEEDGQWTSTGDLTFDDETTIHIIYGSTPPSKTDAPIVLDNLTLGEDLTVVIPNDSLDSLEVGETYPLITWSDSGPTDASDITTFLAFRTFADLSVVGNTLFMTITGSAPGPISWNIGDGTWDSTTANWLDVQDNTTFYFDNLDTVIFGDVPSVDENDPIAVTLDSVFSPVEVIVDGEDHNYTLTGSGSLTGPASLTVDIPSTRTFTLGMANSFTGGTNILSGTLAMTNNLSMGGNNAIINVADGATFNMNGAKTGNNNYHAFIIGDGVNDAGAVINTTADRTAGLGRLTLNGDASIGGTNRWDFRPQTAGSGFIDLNDFTLTKVGTNHVAIVDLIVTEPGTIIVNSGRLGFTRSTVSGEGPVIVNETGTLEFENYSGGSFNKAIEINGGLMRLFGNAAFTTGTTISITGDTSIQADNNALTLAGIISGTGSITKLGGTAVILNAANTYTGNTIISTGSLTLGAVGSIDDSPSVRINSGAVLTTTAKSDHTLPAGQTIEFVVNPAGDGNSGRIVATGLDVSQATATFDALDTLDDPAYIIATYSSLTGAPFANVTLPAGYTIDYSFEGNQIALVEAPPTDADYDAWAAQFPDADLSDPDADFDGDGLTNNQERLFGLDPTDPSSVNPVIVPLDAAAGMLSFTRRDPALTGYDYEIWTSTDLVEWSIDTGAILTPAAPVNDVETVAVELSPALLDEPRLFVRIGASLPGPLFFEDFEEDDGGFTVVTLGGTAWEYGAPNSPDIGGGDVTTAFSGSNCWGTNLTGPYVASTDTSLRSRVIDLTDVTAASLEFAMAIDANVGHTIAVNVIEANTDTVIANILPPTGDTDSTISPWAIVGPLPLPTEAFGQEVRLEWRFVGNGDDFYNGVYIDQVVITEDDDEEED